MSFTRHLYRRYPPFCILFSGILLSFDIVLTAAHCSATSNVVYSGMYNVLNPTAFVNRQLNIRKYIVTDVLVHPHYNNETRFDNDLCLLRLRIDMDFPLYTEPPELGSMFYPLIQMNDDSARPSSMNGNTTLNVAGWGVSEKNINYSPKLRHTTVIPISNDNCTDKFVMNGNVLQFITPNMLCCVSPTNILGQQNAACRGDSGGPLVIHSGADNGVDDLLLGLISFGYKCEGDTLDNSKPGVFSRVSENIEWIEENVCALSEYSVCDENGKLRKRIIMPVYAPTLFPTREPSKKPTRQPTFMPTGEPTGLPTLTPTGDPSVNPTKSPSNVPSGAPSIIPSNIPSRNPSVVPTSYPSDYPSLNPSFVPTVLPSVAPSGGPSNLPTCNPSNNPSFTPSFIPTDIFSHNPSVTVTSHPSNSPSLNPSESPTLFSSSVPTALPSVALSGGPSNLPIKNPSNNPSLTLSFNNTTQLVTKESEPVVLNNKQQDDNTNNNSSSSSSFYLFFIICSLQLAFVLAPSFWPT